MNFLKYFTRYSGLILLISFALGAMGAWFTVKLYQNLRTDMEEMLPETARSVKDYQAIASRVSSYQSLGILIFSEQTQKSKQFVIDLAEQLQKIPADVLAYLEYKIENELNFFKERKALFVDLNDLKKIHQFIEDRIHYEIHLYNPLTILDNLYIPEPSLDFKYLEKKYSSKTSQFENLPEGFYTTPDQKIRLILAHLNGRGLGQCTKLQQAVLKTIDSLNPTQYAADLKIQLTGTVEDMIEESAALVEDLEISTLIVVLLVFAVMYLFFQSFWATILLNFSLFIGTFWTFGLAYWIVGYLNANTAFLASIVIGNGINFGVIFLARYLEERRNQKPHATALEIAMRKTFAPTGMAAAAAGLSYGSLMLTKFRGFSQFGIIGLLGMTLCWLSSFIVLPALLSICDKYFQNRWIRLTKPKISFYKILELLIQNHSKKILFLNAISILACVYVFPKWRQGIFLNDLSKLRDKRCLESGSGAYFHYMEKILNFPTTPSYILPTEKKYVLPLVHELKKVAQNPQTHISSIFSISDFIPTEQTEKIKVIKQIQSTLNPYILQHLNSAERDKIKSFLTPKALQPFSERDLPELILKKFSEKDQTVGKMILVDRYFNPVSDTFEEIREFVNTIRLAVEKIAPGTPVIGSIFINYDLFETIYVDGPKATFFSFIAVTILVIFLFRRVNHILQVLFSLLLATLWLIGIMLAYSLKINFLNFIALPITFGIGVDYAINIIQRYREEGSHNIAHAVSCTGGAVILASLTTIIGYGSLLIAGNQAFVSFGILAVLGEIACVLSAVITLPACIQVFQAAKKA